MQDPCCETSYIFQSYAYSANAEQFKIVVHKFVLKQRQTKLCAAKNTLSYLMQS